MPAGQCTFELQLDGGLPLSWQQRLLQQEDGDPDENPWAGGLLQQLQQLQQPGASVQQLPAQWGSAASHLCRLMGAPGELLQLPQGYTSRVNLDRHRLRIK